MINRDGQGVWTPDDPYGDEAEGLAARRRATERVREGIISVQCWTCGEWVDEADPECGCDAVKRPDPEFADPDFNPEVDR